jgi:hypothetical protein
MPHGHSWSKRLSQEGDSIQLEAKQTFTSSKRPKLKRRLSKNVLNEAAEIHVTKKRLGADAPKELLIKKFPKESMKRIDYVIVHKTVVHNEGKKNEMKAQKKEEMRLTFNAAILAEGMQVQRDVIGEFTYIKIHTPFWRLCKEAESMQLEMPLIGVRNYFVHLVLLFISFLASSFFPQCELYDDDDACCGCLKCWEKVTDKYFQTDNEGMQLKSMMSDFRRNKNVFPSS